MRLKSIKLTLEQENIEFEIDGKYIGDFLIDDIGHSLVRASASTNSFEMVDYANAAYIEIHKDADRLYKPFHFGIVCDTTLFERIAEREDISYIEVVLSDGKTYGYFLRNCKAHISKCGHLYLLFSKEKELSDLLDLDRINDDLWMDCHFDMMGVPE